MGLPLDTAVPFLVIKEMKAFILQSYIHTQVYSNTSENS